MAQQGKAPVASQSILMILVPEPHMTERREPTVRLSSALHTYTMVSAYAHTHMHTHIHTSCNVKFYYRERHFIMIKIKVNLL